MTSARLVHYTYAEYLSALEVSELRLKYLDGEIFAMAAGTPDGWQTTEHTDEVVLAELGTLSVPALYA